MHGMLVASCTPPECAMPAGQRGTHSDAVARPRPHSAPAAQSSPARLARASAAPHQRSLIAHGCLIRQGRQTPWQQRQRPSQQARAGGRRPVAQRQHSQGSEPARRQQPAVWRQWRWAVRVRCSGTCRSARSGARWLSMQRAFGAPNHSRVCTGRQHVTVRAMVG